MKKLIVKILLFLIIIIAIPEIYFRIYFHNFFIQNPLRYLESDIEGVPYLQVNFSDYTINKTKPRIIVLGDYISIHRSWQDNTTYPEVLDSDLNHSFEIINTGADYYSLPEEMNLLKNKALNYNPDIIVVGCVFNDLDLNNPENAIASLKLKQSISEFRIITPLAIEYLSIQNKFSNITKLYENKTDILEFYAALYNDTELRNLLRDSLNELNQIKEERGIEVIFVIIPIFYDFENKDITYMNDVVYTECSKSGIICINLLEIFKKYDVMVVKENDGDIWHQNSLGNKIIATEIQKTITSDPKFRNVK